LKEEVSRRTIVFAKIFQKLMPKELPWNLTGTGGGESLEYRKTGTNRSSYFVKLPVVMRYFSVNNLFNPSRANAQ